MNRESGNTRTTFANKLNKKVYFMHNGESIVEATLIKLNPSRGKCKPSPNQSMHESLTVTVPYEILHTCREGDVDSNIKVSLGGIEMIGDKGILTDIANDLQKGHVSSFMKMFAGRIIETV